MGRGFVGKYRTGCLLMSILLFSASGVAAPIFGPPQQGSVSPSRENCRIYFFLSNDPEPPLNIRSSPEEREDNVIATMPNGRYGDILAEKNGWFQISLHGLKIPQGKGWIAANRTEYDCNEFREIITSFPYLIPGSRLVGTGTHAYEFELKKGQVLVIRPEPPANGKLLRDWPTAVGGPGVPRQAKGFPNPYAQWWRKTDDTSTPEPPEWRWIVTQSGSYTIYFESNYKGFSYGASVVELEEAATKE